MLKSLSTSLPFYGFKTHSPEMLEWGMEKQKGLLRILTIPNHLRTTMHLWPESGHSNLTGMLLPLWDGNNIMMQKFQTFNYSELRGMNLTSLLMWTCNIKFENSPIMSHKYYEKIAKFHLHSSLLRFNLTEKLWFFKLFDNIGIFAKMRLLGWFSNTVTNMSMQLHRA